MKESLTNKHTHLLIRESLYSLLPSTIPDIGLENHSLKSRWDSKTWGMRKCIRDQSSAKFKWLTRIKTSQVKFTHQVVLKRSACQKQSAQAGEIQEQLPALGFEVLDVLCLVQNEILPLEPSKAAVVLDNQLVAGDTNVEGILFGPTPTFHPPVFLGAVIDKYLEGGAPLFDFHLPVEHDRSWHHDQVGSPHAFFQGQVSQKSNGLDCLSQTHFISKDSIKRALKERDHPIKTNMLIFSEGML